jgi:hypothetical protein
MTLPNVVLQPGQSVTVSSPGSTPPPPVKPVLDPGWAAQIDTGHITAFPSAWSYFSPATPSSVGEWAGNLVVSPAGNGLRVNYPTNLDGGNSPVRFGRGIPAPGSGGRYERRMMWFSPGFVFPVNTGIKVGEPRTLYQGSVAGAFENHIIGTFGTSADQLHSVIATLLQGPNGNFRDIFPTLPAGDLTGGAGKLCEWLFRTEAVPGEPTGTCQMAVDGVVVANETNVQWLAAGQTPGWPYWMVDPTYGGAPASVHPPALQWWEFDELFVSTSP